MYNIVNEEEKTQTDKEFYSFVYDFAPCGYFILEKEGKIVNVNQSAALMLKADVSVLKRQNIKNYIASDSKPVFNNFVKRLFSNNLRHCCKVNFSIQNSVKEIHLEGTLFDSNKYIISAVDANDKNQNQELLLKHHLFKQIFDSSKDGIIIFRAASGIITDVNNAFCQLSAYNKEELLDTDISKLFEADPTSDILNELKNNYTLKQYKLLTKDNTIIDVEIVTNDFMLGSDLEIQCNVRDISERKRSEIELKENESRLKDLNDAKDKFISIISHDLRTPFNCIIGYCDLLIQKAEKQDFRKIENYAHIVHQASWRAMNLLTDLIDWSRSQTGKLEYNPEKVDINTVVSEAFVYVQDAAEQKQIQLETNIPTGISVYADNSMLKTILRNLVSNAIKYTEPEGKVIVSAVNRPGEVRFTVCDTGIGMSPDIVANLFKIAKSTSTPGTNNEHGTGLGLLICKEFVEFHKGKIWVLSKPGEGSRFNFTIPVRVP